MNPGAIDSTVVGIGLMALAFFYFIQAEIVLINIPDWVRNYGGWIIPLIFLLRSIGDFKYAGFFKKIRATEFSKNDSKIFAPLCLLIAVMGFIIIL